MRPSFPRAVALALALLLLAGSALAAPWDAVPLDPEALRAEARKLREPSGEEAGPERAKAAARRADLLEELARLVEMTVPDAARADADLLVAEADLAAEQKREAAVVDPGAIRTREDVAPFVESARRAAAARDAATKAHQSGRALVENLEKAAGTLDAREDAAVATADAAGEDELSKFRAGTAALELVTIRTYREKALPALPALRVATAVAAKRQERAVLVADRAAAALTGARELLQNALEKEAARREAEAARTEDPVERAFLDLDARITTAEAETTGYEDVLTKISARKKSEERIRDRLAGERRRLEARLEGAGAGARRTAELLLGTLRRTQDALATIRKRTFPRVESEIEEYQAARVEVEDARFALEPDSPEYEEAWAELAATLSEDRHENARSRLTMRRSELRDALAAQVGKLNEIIVALDGLHAAVAARQADLESLYSLVISRVYWIRSDPPIDLDTVEGVAADVAALAAVYTGRELFEGFETAYAESKASLLLAAGGVLLLVFAGGFINLRLKRYRTRWRYRGSPLLVVIQRLGASVLMSALAPACLALASVLLAGTSLPRVIVGPGSDLLWGLSIILFARRFLWALFREEGIARAEMGAPEGASVQLLAASRWAAAMAAALILPTWILSSEPLSLVHLPRVLYALTLLAGALILINLIGRRRPLMMALTKGRGLWHRSSAFLSPLLSLGLLGIVVMDVLGYRFGARLLIGNVLETFVAALILVGVYSLLTGVIEGGVQRVLRGRGAADLSEGSWKVRRRLTRFAGVIVVLVAVFLLSRFWGIDGQLRSFFDAVVLATIDAETSLTLWNVLVALAWVVGCHFVLRNQPALFDVLLFPRMEVSDAGTRFVLLTIARYVTLLVGYAAALLTLHVSFGSLGWLLAAASIGIGFGLQEIIANFVSGLILLIERPVRVEDMIRVGDVVGRVKRINIRATIIESEDREVLLIPNRELITQQVTNWTHNDEVIRRQVSVGIAYGADVEGAVKLMLEAAREHPKVRKDPEPNVLFVGFGDSSLDFTLHFFVPASLRNPVRSELHVEINRRFAEAGIPIPFPQRDVWMRTEGA